ncbi:hypothetical protein [Vibrio gallaecicus]|nr:hypothetical protein [Vibrio gallaecicus]MDN3617459.1 hypothetical protein [Vibrio gallaecicus]
MVFTVQWFRLGGRRCSLLNAALGQRRSSGYKTTELFVGFSYDEWM